ncbi:MAG TPA: glycosyltransferase [Jiangellaceae bacterium]|nr:glycosyltransferase [Jiangellaceae bacterium]
MKISLVYSSHPGQTAGNVDAESLHAHVFDLAEALTGRGHQVAVEALRQDPVERMGRAVRDLEKSWKAALPDIVHAHLWSSGLAALATMHQSSELGRIPLVQTFHGLNLPSTGASARAHEWRRLEAAVARGVDKIAASSRREVSDLVTLGARRRDIEVIPHGVDTRSFTPEGEAEPRSDGDRLLAVGPLTAETGFDIAIRAMPALPDVELVIAGGRPSGQDGEWSFAKDDEAARLADLARKLNVADRVHVVEKPPRDQLPKLLRSADIVICTPWHEASGTAAIDAMACGRPVVAAAVGELLDVVIEGTTGVLVPPRNPVALARAIRSLLEDPIRLDGFGLAAADRISIRHSWVRVTDDVIRTYKHAVAR